MKPADLLPQVYSELRRLAAAKMADEAPGHMLEATALVHEAYLKLGGERTFATRLDYLRAAAEAMRRILIDHARQRNAVKRGAGKTVEATDDAIAMPEPNADVEALDEAINRLAAIQPQIVELVRLRYFAGLSNTEAAALLGIAPRTADGWWAYARGWLASELIPE